MASSYGLTSSLGGLEVFHDYDQGQQLALEYNMPGDVRTELLEATQLDKPHRNIESLGHL
jgi:hypothetical protein